MIADAGTLLKVAQLDAACFLMSYSGAVLEWSRALYCRFFPEGCIDSRLKTSGLFTYKAFDWCLLLCFLVNILPLFCQVK